MCEANGKDGKVIVVEAGDDGERGNDGYDDERQNSGAYFNKRGEIRCTRPECHGGHKHNLFFSRTSSLPSFRSASSSLFSVFAFVPAADWPLAYYVCVHTHGLLFRHRLGLIGGADGLRLTKHILSSGPPSVCVCCDDSEPSLSPLFLLVHVDIAPQSSTGLSNNNDSGSSSTDIKRMRRDPTDGIIIRACSTLDLVCAC